MKAKLYLESTVPSYLVARQSRDIVTAGHQATTREWWAKRIKDFQIFISPMVIEEVSMGEAAMAKARLEILKPFPQLEITESVTSLAETLIVGGTLPRKAARDAVHVAVSAIHGMHFLVTWNCRHIANGEILRKVQKVCREHECECPLVCTPDELMGEL